MMSDTVPEAQTGRRLPYNKACGLEDFADPELVAVLRDIYAHEAGRSGVYPAGAEHRKPWEVAMSVRALRDFGALRPDADILGVGAGSEITVFYLTRQARRVVVTDLYLAPGKEWEKVAPPLMMIAPERLSPIPFERERLEVLHMDGRWLRFPDDSFDGIFSSGSIEHFGDFEDIAAAACEMARVLKPGGVLTLSTELLLEGPAGANGWPGTMLFSAERLRRQVIEASGLEPVDSPDLAISPRTMATTRSLLELVEAAENGREIFPHLVLTHEGQVFASVHLTLRKTERYPVPDNAWARPSEELRARVRRSEAEAEKRLFGASVPVAPPVARPLPVAAPPAPAAPADPSGEDTGRETGLEEAFRGWEAVRVRSSLPPEQGAVRRAVGFLGRTATRVRDLGVSWELQRDLFQALIDRQADLDRRLQALEGTPPLFEQLAPVLAPLLASLEDRVAGLKTSEANILGALDAMWNLHEKHEAAARSGGGESSGELANLRDRHEILRVRQTRLEGALADLREELAALRGEPSASVLPLTPRDVAEILADLEKGMPEGERPGAVEISLQGGPAESLLLAARRHFGGRLSSSGPSYRGPNDLWIHVDFTAGWERPARLENAAARLQPGGRFLLITAPGHGEAPRHPGLALEEDRGMSLGSGGTVRVIGWRKG
jgi:SAM-dependent methyltransferase